MGGADPGLPTGGYTWAAPHQLRGTYHEQQTLALLVRSTTAQEPQQHQRRPDGDAEKAHVDELHTLSGEGSQQLEKGAPIHAYPDPHGEQGQTSKL